MLRQVVLSANQLSSYAYARHAVANCPQGQFRDPTPPRGRGAYGVVAKGDAHAALALHAPLDRARRVALTRCRHHKVAALALLSLVEWYAAIKSANSSLTPRLPH